MAYAEQVLMDRLRASEMDDLPDAPHSTKQGSEHPPPAGAKSLYFGLLDARPSEAALEQSRHFLAHQLDCAREFDSNLPASLNGLPSWMKENSIAIGKRYRRYLDERKAGHARRYFPGKSHAMHFLNAVAPTKLVDGAWLYGLISQWRDPRYAELIRIYLEELGEGDPDKNHVLMYKSLLAAQDCHHWTTLDDDYFVQGAIQLSLAQNTHEFLPEVIGFNLGYEQLPLHLLICAYELKELGIDPYYFTLHVTIDNASSGHAARAVKSVTDALPQAGDREAFYQRIRNGFRLNTLGAGSTGIIAGFDLDQELIDILTAKASVGALLHSDYCRVAGKTVSEWLSSPGRVRGFVDALQEIGWIRRHQHPDNSRFWKLITGEKAPMFGVFSTYEQQVIHDWISGTRLKDARWRRSAANGSTRRVCSREGMDADSRLLRDALSRTTSQSAGMDLMVPWLSPVRHHTAAGLMATRLFAQGMRT